MAKSVKHSGHLGDIIYSLSFVKQLNERVDYYLGFDRVSTTPNHPSGKALGIKQSVDNTTAAIKRPTNNNTLLIAGAGVAALLLLSNKK